MNALADYTKRISTELVLFDLLLLRQTNICYTSVNISISVNVYM